MKYLILILGIVILGLSVWGLVGDRAGNSVCGNVPNDYKGWRDCTPPVRVKETGELAMKEDSKAWSLVNVLEKRQFGESA